VPREDGGLPTHVTTPEGETLELMGEALSAEVSRRHGHPVMMMQLNHGIFDEAAISVIAEGTVAEICRLAGKAPDVRRFRPNILIRTPDRAAFGEDRWVGGTLSFGEGEAAPAISVTMKDPRCVMVNLDPDGGNASPEVMKAAVRANDNNAGVYCTVTRAGQLRVGQTVTLHQEAIALAAAMPQRGG
jgi:uncharacterized protein YcbX